MAKSIVQARVGTRSANPGGADLEIFGGVIRGVEMERDMSASVRRKNGTGSRHAPCRAKMRGNP